MSYCTILYVYTHWSSLDLRLQADDLRCDVSFWLTTDDAPFTLLANRSCYMWHFYDYRLSSDLASANLNHMFLAYYNNMYFTIDKTFHLRIIHCFEEFRLQNYVAKPFSSHRALHVSVSTAKNEKKGWVHEHPPNLKVLCSFGPSVYSSLFLYLTPNLCHAETSEIE